MHMPTGSPTETTEKTTVLARHVPASLQPSPRSIGEQECTSPASAVTAHVAVNPRAHTTYTRPAMSHARGSSIRKRASIGRKEACARLRGRRKRAARVSRLKGYCRSSECDTVVTRSHTAAKALTRLDVKSAHAARSSQKGTWGLLAVTPGTGAYGLFGDTPTMHSLERVGSRQSTMRLQFSSGSALILKYPPSPQSGPHVFLTSQYFCTVVPSPPHPMICTACPPRRQSVHFGPGGWSSQSGLPAHGASGQSFLVGVRAQWDGCGHL
mmetsp:Transcript_56218/g.137866  ORF Transcript_56218/g.137866 Transcript_56218/m.137866 type:complete len:268 (-) Transcript_56218:947-1750(-)